MKNKYTIAEVKDLLSKIEREEEKLFQELLLDERKGVQQALSSWRKRQFAAAALRQKSEEMNEYEDSLFQKGFQYIAGVDEAGRGPLAGPVAAGCVVLDRHKPILGLDDSKKLSLKKRLELFEEIHEKALGVGLGMATAEEIDRYNIYQATRLAMNRAVEQCFNSGPDFLLIDAMTLDIDLPQQSIVKGDSKSNSIAAASIIAKVSRDRLMEQYDEEYPGYGFAKNSGYGTKEHLEGLKQLGAAPVHRKTFAPIKKYL